MKNIIFFIRHFTERGTEVSAYDYAKYNEEILGNKSYICCFTPSKQSQLGWPMIRVSYEKFSSRFKIFELNDISDIKNIIETFHIDFFYTQTHGTWDIYQFNNKNIWGSCKTIKHCVFDTTAPEGDFYISISNHLNTISNTTLPVIPYIVSLPETNDTLRNELNIPENAIVLGRHGGYNQFNIDMTHKAIEYILNKNTDIYFLFMNTKKFYTHPRIIYLDCNLDLIYKRKFINTCDAMIHSRSIGETFGLSIAEFSYCNKPVITCKCGDLEHIKILGDKAIIYTTYEELVDIFTNINRFLKSKTDWNAYRFYSPENVMNLFNKLIFQKDFNNIFVYVIASFGNPIYDELIRMRKLQFKKYNIPHIFLYDTLPPENTTLDESDIVFIKSPLTHEVQCHPDLNPHMTVKFLKGLHLIDETKYKYIIRLNVSVFVDFEQLLTILSSNIGKTNFAAGPILCHKIPDWSIDPVNPFEFISGTCMIFSSDTIQFLKSMPFDDELYYTHNDDVILSYIVKKHCKSFTNINITWNIDTKSCLYRIKDDYDRREDIKKWKHLLHSIDSIDA